MNIIQLWLAKSSKISTKFKISSTDLSALRSAKKPLNTWNDVFRGIFMRVTEGAAVPDEMSWNILKNQVFGIHW